MTVTMKDIAAKCGLSVATVSKVLNGKDEDVAEATKALIRRTSKEMGYVVNGIARSMKTKNTKTLGIMMPDIKNAFYMDICRGAEDMAMRRGYSLLLCNTDDKIEKEIHYLEKLMEQQVDGIIIIASMERNTELEETVRLRVPFAVLNRNTHYPACSARVVVDNEQGMIQAVSHLTKLGHKHIFYLEGATDLLFGEDRRKGYREGLLQAQIPYRSSYVGTAGFSMESAQEYLHRYGLPKEVTAVCAGNDLMALGVLQWAREKGLRVPEDLSVIGYDDSVFSRVATPLLTTVQQQSYRSGELLVEELLENLEKKQALREVHLDSSLIIRQSTGPVSLRG